MKQTKFFSFFIAFNIACLIIEDPVLRLWVAAITGVVQTILLLILTRENNPLNIFPLSMLLWMVQFPMTGFMMQLLDLPLSYGVTLPYLGPAVVLANICQLIVASVWKLPIWLTLACKVPRLTFPTLTEATGALTILWGMSQFFRLFSFFSGYQPGFEVEAGTLEVTTNLLYMGIGLLSLFPIICFCGFMRSERKNVRLLGYLVLITEVVFVTIFSGSKAGPTITLINFAIAYHYVVRPIKPAITWTLIAIMAILVIPFYAVKMHTRTYLILNYELSQERPKLGFSDYVDMYSNAFDMVADVSPSVIAEETSMALISRFDTLTVLAATIAYYDGPIGYDTPMYLSLWVKPYIPRAMWPEKGWVGLGLFVSNEILGVPGYTHAAVTSTIEGYIGGGPFGAIILSILHGAFVAFGVAYLMATPKGCDSSFTRAIFASMFLVFLYFNSSFSIPRGVVTNLFAIWGLVKILALAGARLVRVAPVSHYPGVAG